MFYLTKIENGRMNVPEPEYLPAGTTAINEGETLTLASGKLVLNTTAPTFIALAGAAANAESVPVCRIEKNHVYSVPCSVAPTSAFVPGAKLAVASDGLQVGAASDSGAVTIVQTLGAKAVGDHILVRF